MDDEAHDEAVVRMMFGEEDAEKQEGWDHFLNCTDCLLRTADACAARRTSRGGALAMCFRQRAAALLH